MKHYAITSAVCMGLGAVFGAYTKHKLGWSWQKRLALAVPYGAACSVAGYLAWKQDELEARKSFIGSYKRPLFQ